MKKASSADYKKLYAKIGFRVTDKGNISCCHRKKELHGKLKMNKPVNCGVSGHHLSSVK